VAARSNAYVCDRSPAEIVGSNPAGGIVVSCECYGLSGRGVCVGLITRQEESYRLWSVVMCDLETSCMRGPWPAAGLLRQKKEKRRTEQTRPFTARRKWRRPLITSGPVSDQHQVHKISYGFSMRMGKNSQPVQ